MKNKGFTISEVIISAFIVAWVLIGIVAFYIMLQTVWSKGRVQIALYRKARITMEKIVRGVNGRYGIREGRIDALVISGTDNITVAVDMNEPPTPEDDSDDTTISFYANTNQLMYDPDTALGGNEFSIEDNLMSGPSGLKFSATSGVVTVGLGLIDTFRGEDITVDLSTSVKLRN